MEGHKSTANLPVTMQRSAEVFGRAPDYFLAGGAGNLIYAAKWTMPKSSGSLLGPEYILSYHVAGTTAVSKVVGGKQLGTHAPLQTVNFISRDEGAVWSLGGDLTAVMIYLHPALLQRFAEQYSATGRPPSINPFFALEDTWLRGYFQMLMSEVESSGGGAFQYDSFLLEQSQLLLFRHLLSRYSSVSKPDLRELESRRADRPLLPLLLKRVVDFVHENLSAEIHLANLSGLVHMSEYHFIRAFHAATGSTPYQYVLEKRLMAAADLLTNDGRSVGEIAGLVGFKSASYFAAKFRAYYGLTPTHYRETCKPLVKDLI